MKLYKVLSLAMCVFLFATQFNSYSFASGDGSFSSYGENVIYEDDFSDGVMDVRTEKTGGDGILEEKEGKLVLTRTSKSPVGTNSSDGCKIYLHSDKSAAYDYFTQISFTISKSDDKQFITEVFDYDGNVVTGLNFMADGKVSAQYKNSDEIMDVTVFANTEINVTYKFNHISGLFSLWFDSVLLLDNVEYKTASSDNIHNISFKLTRGNVASLNIENFRACTYDVADSDAVEYEKKLLTFDKLTTEFPDAITSDLNLFDVGSVGCDIEWLSSDEDVISKSGAVIRPEDEDKEVVITANIHRGDASVAKEFEVVVKKIEASELPGVKSVIAEYNDMKSIDAGTSAAYDLKISTASVLGINLTADSSGEYALKILDNDGEVALELKRRDNTIYVKESDGSFEPIKSGCPSQIKYTLLLDVMTKKFSLWSGKEKLVSLGAISGDVDCVSSVMAEQISGSGHYSDFKVFYAIATPEEAIILDYEYLTFETLSYQEQTAVTTDLRLKTEGRAGSVITWESSDENVIGIDGSVNSSEEKTVTLTATISSGSEETLQKKFEVNVAKWDKSEKIEVKNMILEEYFDDNNVNTIWDFAEGEGNINISDEGLIISRQTNTDDGATSAELFMDGNSTIYRGVYALEFTVHRSKNAEFVIRQKGTGNYVSASWMTDGSIHYWADVTADKFKNSAIKITFLYDTSRSVFSVLVDDKMIQKNCPAREEGNGISTIRLYLERSHLCDATVDNVRFYEAYLHSDDRVENDYGKLTELSVIDENDTAWKHNMISRNLNLPLLGAYASEISWESSDESIISSEGIVNRSADENKEVTLTATIKSGDYVKTKELKFTVMKLFGEDYEAAQYDTDSLTYDAIAAYDNGSNKIVRSLVLSDTAVYGSDVTWKSSDINHITNSGRVIRPHWNEEDAEVTMTATIRYGTATITKDFNFTVLKDEKWSDPQFMADEEFFGVWDGEKWIVESKLNYEFEGLETVGDAVKSGNLELAKERLQAYYAKRAPKTKVLQSSRNTLWTSALLDDFYNLQGSAYYQGDFQIGTEWDLYESKINTDNITPGAVSCYTVRSWYNESSYAEIKRHNDSNEKYRPRIELKVNGAIRTYYAVDSAAVRAGDYRDTNYYDSDVMKIQTFGDFLENDTCHSVLKFDFSDLTADDKITSAKLIVYGKASPAYAGEKRMIVLRENTTVWSSETAVWNTFIGIVYSYNGLPGKNSWTVNPVGSDFEYYYQHCRFYGFHNSVMAEYVATGDEEIMYKTLSILNDYLHDTGDYKMIDTGTPNENGLRGGFTRTIDAKSKNEAFIGMIELIAQSKTTTPDLFTAILKNIWDTTNYMASYHSPSGNWRQIEFQAMLITSAKMPEFADSLYALDNTKRCLTTYTDCCQNEFNGWRDEAQNELESMLFTNTLDDGSYVESTGGYNTGAFSGFRIFKEDMIKLGISVTPEYDELLYKSAYYNLLLFTPDGRTLQYGDESATTTPRDGGIFSNISEWYNDEEFEYILSFGQSGKEPEWTSTHFPLSTATMMRANWSTSSPFLFTNVRGGGQHGHADYNGVIVTAYGRTLLVDAGIFTYTETDPFRKWGKSTAAHNTVLINDTSQIRDANGGKKATGTVYDWTTNSSFDYLSQSTPQNEGFEHRRTITFIKPTLWIVSDLMIPENVKKENNYKQIWHMLPTSGMKTSQKDHIVYSNFDEGANVIVANADGDNAQVKTELGYYDKGYQQVQESEYSYFEKKGKGNVTFDSVIIPSNNDRTAKATAEKLATSDNATALQINFTLDGEKNTAYYYMSYDDKGGDFGKYSTDGQVAYVQEDENGKITYAMIKNGSFIKDKSGKYIVESKVLLDEFAVTMSGETAEIVTAQNTDVSNVSVAVDKLINKATLNKNKVVCTISDGILTSIDAGKAPEENTENVPSAGIDESLKKPDKSESDDSGKNKPGSGGSGGSGGNSGSGSSVVIPGIPADNTVAFPDIKNHWAENYISDLKKNGIVNGDGEGNFNPDKSITRAEFTAMIVRVMKLEAADYAMSFNDVKISDWHSGVIQTALDNGLISADVNFRPDDNISRQEMAKIMSVAMQKSASANDTEIVIAEFTDIQDVSEWAKEYVNYICSVGLMNGMDDGSFRPLNNATRAEAATIISRFLNKSNQ